MMEVEMWEVMSSVRSDSEFLRDFAKEGMEGVIGSRRSKAMSKNWRTNPKGDAEKLRAELFASRHAGKGYFIGVDHARPGVDDTSVAVRVEEGSFEFVTRRPVEPGEVEDV